MAKRSGKANALTVDRLMHWAKEVRTANAGKADVREALETLLNFMISGPDAPPSVDECDTATRFVAMLLYDVSMPEDAAGAMLH